MCCAAGALPHTDALADPVSPTFLPPRAESTREHSKKDRHARDRSPRLQTELQTWYNVHTGEAVVLGESPGEDDSALVSRLLRDRTNWEEHVIAPTSVEAVRRAGLLFHARRVEFISGYRSDKLNELLRKKGRHVAQHSQHVLGHALDFRLVGVDTRLLLRHMRATHDGGVGFYPQSGFVHVDSGARRRWSGE